MYALHKIQRQQQPIHSLGYIVTLDNPINKYLFALISPDFHAIEFNLIQQIRSRIGMEGMVGPNVATRDIEEDKETQRTREQKRVRGCRKRREYVGREDREGDREEYREGDREGETKSQKHNRSETPIL